MPADYDPRAFFIYMELEVEIWKDVVGYEGEYLVSSFGRVKSLKNYHGVPERILKQCMSRKYLIVSIGKYYERKTFSVHVLVAMAFHGHVPDGTHKICVDHIDNNPLNNRADNLQLISARENVIKDMKKGSTTDFIGIRFVKRLGKWVSYIVYNKRKVYLGMFDLEIDAANAYQKARKEVEQGLDLNVLYPISIKTSQYKGVCWHKQSGMWQSTYRCKYLGLFDTDLEAHEVRQKYILQLQENVIILS